MINMDRSITPQNICLDEINASLTLPCAGYGDDGQHIDLTVTAAGPTKVLTAQGSAGQKVGETLEEVTAQQQRMQHIVDHLDRIVTVQVGRTTVEVIPILSSRTFYHHQHPCRFRPGF